MYDVIIIGTGIAGLTCALKLSEKNSDLKIVCLSKNSIKHCNTRLAQGGIACVKLPQDSYEKHIHDTQKASQYTSNKGIVELVVKKSKDCINDLETWGVNFDKKDKKFDLGLEGGHSLNRIVHVADHTGKTIHNYLLRETEKHTNIQLLAFHEAYEIILFENKSFGLKTYSIKESVHKILYTQKIVIATGGIGYFFKQSTNSYCATGDGLVLAHNLGVEIKNLKSIQFHPTAFYEQNKKKLFLISEAVRGAGALIVNEKGVRFLLDYDPRGELATRDVLSKAIFDELKLSKQKCVFMDLHQIKDFNTRFPSINSFLTKKNIDWRKNLVPVIPAAHYQCGGIKVDENACTSIKNLYAIGECAETGLHGINRLASNSLLEAFVFGENCAKTIYAKKNIQPERIEHKNTANIPVNTSSVSRTVSKLQNVLFEQGKNENFQSLFSEIKNTVNSEILKYPHAINLIRVKNRIEVLSLIANSF